MTQLTISDAINKIETNYNSDDIYKSYRVLLVNEILYYLNNSSIDDAQGVKVRLESIKTNFSRMMDKQLAIDTPFKVIQDIRANIKFDYTNGELEALNTLELALLKTYSV